jgi:hypothetical protein
MVLVVGPTLFIGTLVKLQSVERGFRTDGVLTFGLNTAQQYLAERSLAIQSTVLDRIAATPGVASATSSRVTSIGGGLWDRSVQVEGYTFRADENETVGFNAIAPKYSATLSTPMLLGREFDEHGTNVSKKVAVVNESFARSFFGARSPLGQHVTSVRVTYEIVGVVKDAKYQDLRWHHQDYVHSLDAARGRTDIELRLLRACGVGRSDAPCACDGARRAGRRSRTPASRRESLRDGRGPVDRDRAHPGGAGEASSEFWRWWWPASACSA